MGFVREINDTDMSEVHEGFVILKKIGRHSCIDSKHYTYNKLYTNRMYVRDKQLAESINLLIHFSLVDKTDDIFNKLKKLVS